MTNREENKGRLQGENQRIGKDLYNQDNRYNQPRSGRREPSQKEWGEGNYFHTGPSSRGAQDRDRTNRDYSRGSSSSYNQGQNAHLNDHYGSRSNSTYRNERDFLNHGDSRSSGNYQQQNSRSGSAPGNYNEPPKYGEETWREHPGSRSRYKDDDYRYGSGSHNWYTENRYTHDESRDPQDNRGFFERMGSGIKNTWNDIMHSDDPDYVSNTPDRPRQSERISSRERHGSEQFRDRHYDNGYNRSHDKGYEGGPRWADETDSGDDDYYNDRDRNQRYRR